METLLHTEQTRQAATEDEARLVRAARAGDNDAAAELFERHLPGAWRAAFGVTASAAAADDVVQDAFMRALGALPRFDERRPFAPWLHRIVVRTALNALRAGRRTVPLEDAPPLRADAHDPGGARLVLDALARLPVPQRSVVVLRHWLGYTPTEIGVLLDLPTGTVQSRLGRGLDRLRAYLEEVDRD